MRITTWCRRGRSIWDGNKSLLKGKGIMRGKVKSKSKLSYMHVLVTILELKRGFSCDVDQVTVASYRCLAASNS
jgi:hypothetical protein